MINALTATLRAALDGADTDLELQVRLLAGIAGEYGRNMLIAAADRILRSYLWQVLTPRPPEVNGLRGLIGAADASQLSIRLYAGQPGSLWLSLCRIIDGWGWGAYLRDVRIPVDIALWSQIQEA